MLKTKLEYSIKSVKLNKDHWAVKLFCLFLATDIAFIVLHVVFSHGALTSNVNFSLEKDRGYSEIVQYVKEYWSALLLGFLAIQASSLLFLSWSGLFFYLLLDDSLRIHERLGSFISKEFSLSPIFGLRAIDLGELTVSALVGLFFLIAIAISYRWGDRFSKKVSKSLIKLLFALAFFGLVVDMLHIGLSNLPLVGRFFDRLLGIVEDGGELVVMSLIVCFLFSLPSQSKQLSNKLIE
ncbi:MULTISPECIES: hypothetical protein [unclassified Anabaena]|uniref:hypothetical protein n=1 Tax=unclassified Anabaena TaxID=2619674 RepID=UPI0039C7251C